MPIFLRRTAKAGISLGRSKVGAVLISLSFFAPTFANAAPCAAPADEASLRVRMMQTELMVAALTCNQRTDYNSFVTRFQPQLTMQGKHLQSFFKQKYGSGSSRALNGFVTRIANESSRRGMQKRGEFCRAAAAIHASTQKITPADLPAYAGSLQFSGWHGVSICPTKVAASNTKQ